MRRDWDVGAEPDRGRSGGASVGVLELANRVVGAHQPVTKLPPEKQCVLGVGHVGEVTWDRSH